MDYRGAIAAAIAAADHSSGNPTGHLIPKYNFSARHAAVQTNTLVGAEIVVPLMAEPPPLCMMCKQPMHRLRTVPIPTRLHITVWRCRFCPRPTFRDLADAGE